MLATCPHCHNAVDVGDGSAVMLCEYCGREFHPAATPVIASGGPMAETPAPPQYRLRITPEERAAHLGRHPAAATPRRAPARHHPLATLGWALGILVLAAALAVQYAYFMREDLARHVALRPWLERLCSYAHCQIPLLRDAASIRIVARDIRRHPGAEGALRVMLTLENESPYVQAYPAIQLSFLDFRGKLLARRRFTPQEYLSVTLDPSRGMPVRQPVQSVIDIVDPGPEAVNFEFLLR